MNKKIIILMLVLAVAVGFLAAFLIKKNNTMVIQGEVETKEIDLASKITGRILKIDIAKGDSVKKGQLLITLDTPDIAAKSEQSDAALSLALAQQQKVNAGTRSEQVSMALSSLKQAQSGKLLAQKTYNRMKNLHSEGVIPAQKLDEAYAKYKGASDVVDAANSQYKMALNGAQYEDKLVAGANVRRAVGAQSEVQSYLKENRLKSPINGEVTDVTVEEGELVGAGYPIVTIVDLSDVWVTFNLREDLLSKIKMGTEFDAVIPALGKQNVRLKVNYISVLGNFATWRATKAKGDFDMKTFEVHAVPVNKTDGLRSGMSAIVDWTKIK